jgi:hypothetical protein
VPGIYFGWAERILNNQKEMLVDPRTEEVDKN